MPMIKTGYDLPIRPAVVSFSGGRSSAYMLWHILQAHGGTLPDDIHVNFANTGKEREETLDFVARIQSEWGVHINWIERAKGNKTDYEVVSHNSASRNGEPFEAFLNTQKKLPSPGKGGRTCTADLKIRPMNLFVKKELGIKKWSPVIGFRADEMHRVAKLWACGNEDENQAEFIFHNDPKKKKRKRKKAKWETEGMHPQTPMAWDSNATRGGVREWWKRMPFDLGIESYEGNCDMCFLKRESTIKYLMRKHPSMAEWWIRQEAVRRNFKYDTAQVFRLDRPKYADILEGIRKEDYLKAREFADLTGGQVRNTEEFWQWMREKESRDEIRLDECACHD